MVRYLLGDLQRAFVEENGGDAGPSERVVAYFRPGAGVTRAAATIAYGVGNGQLFIKPTTSGRVLAVDAEEVLPLPRAPSPTC